MGDRAELDVRQLRALLAVIEHGSLSRAAVALKLAQSTMSETIASLDRAVGTPVLARRRGHRLQLTEAGCALIPHARNIIRELQDARQAISRVTTQVRSTIDVFTVESLSTYLLPSLLMVARKRWPNTRFSVSVAPCATIRTAVQDEQCDLGLMLEERPAGPPERSVKADAGERVIVISEVPLLVFCSPSHPLLQRGARPTLRLDALTEYTVFVSDGAGTYYNMLSRYLTAGRLPGPRVEASGSVEATRLGVLADPAAIGILPAYAIAAHLRVGRATVLRVVPPPPMMRIAAYLPGRAVHPAVQTLVDEARQALSAGGPAAHLASA